MKNTTSQLQLFCIFITKTFCLLFRTSLFFFYFAIHLKAVGQTTLYYQFTHISPNQGLSSTYVRKIVQDPYGFVWIGTQDGLNRYDGKNITIYSKDNTNRNFLSGSDIRDLLIDTSRHTIWVLTSYGGIDGVDYQSGNVWYHYDQQTDSSQANIVLNSIVTHNGELYVGSSDGLFALYPEQKVLMRIVRTSGNSSLNHSFIDKLFKSKSGDIWVFSSDKGIFLLANQNSDSLSTFSTSIEKRFRTYDAAELSDGRVVLCTSVGLVTCTLTYKRGVAVDLNPLSYLKLPIGRDVFACECDRNGMLWISNATSVIRTDPNLKTYEIITENSSNTDESWIASVYDIFIGRDDIVWFGCQQGLAFAKNAVSPFYKFNRAPTSNVRIRHAYYIGPIDDRTLFCCAQEGLYKIDIAEKNVTSLKQNGPFYHAFTGPQNNVIVSSRRGTFVLKGNQQVPWERIYTEFAKLPPLVLNSHELVGDSMLVLGTENFEGVAVWNFKRKEVRLIDTVTYGLRLNEPTVNGLFKGNDGRIWILGDHSVAILSPDLTSCNSFTPHSEKTGIFYSLFFDICEINKNYYLASYGNGVLVLDTSLRVIDQLSAGKELTSNSTYKVFPYKDSVLFVTSNNGLSLVPIQKGLPSTFFFEQDGLNSNTFEENSGCYFHDVIYAGGENGLTTISPSLIRQNSKPPPIYLHELRVERANNSTDTAMVNLSKFRIPSDAIQTTLSFSALSYGSPNAWFEYRIEELHESWISLGSRNVVSLTGIAPGEYNLMVRASIDNHNWTSVPYKIRLIFLPRWYQSLWFKSAVGGLLLLLFYWFYRFRIEQIRKQESIRRSIATDLHDDIGSTLNSVKIFTQLAAKEESNNRYANQIQKSLEQATQGIRDLIWVLDDSRDSLQEFLARVERFAAPVCLAENIALSSDILGDRHTILTKQEKRNLLLIIKELINNVIKHAAATELRLNFLAKGKQLVIEVADNGHGFDVTQNSEGYGIKNIHYRVTQLKWKLKIESSPVGTKVRMQKQ